jgi:hypothetical protein
MIGMEKGTLTSENRLESRTSQKNSAKRPRTDLPVPAHPVKKTLCPANINSNTLFWHCEYGKKYVSVTSRERKIIVAASRERIDPNIQVKCDMK